MRFKVATAITAGVLVSMLFVGIALAGWVTGFYKWDQRPFDSAFGKGELAQQAVWDQYWDDGLGYYTQYKLPAYNNYGRVIVDSASPRRVIKVNALFQDYQPHDVRSYWWVQDVWPGQIWDAYVPYEDLYMTKLQNTGGDGTNVAWTYYWAGACVPIGNFTNNLQFFYAWVWTGYGEGCG